MFPWKILIMSGVTACQIPSEKHVNFVNKIPSHCGFLGEIQGEGESLLSDITAGRNAMLSLEREAIKLGGNTVYTVDDQQIDGNRNSLRWKPKYVFTGKVFQCEQQ